MRLVAHLAFAALALAACAPREAANARCDHSGEAQISLSGEGAADRVVTRVFGAACDRLTGMLVIETEDGTPLYAFASALHPRFGNLFAPAAQTPSQETAQGFVQRWAQLDVNNTTDAPVWSAGEQGPGGTAATTLDRTTYEDVRARALPMTCHLSGVARETCVYWEPGAALAVPLVERDALVANEED